MNIKNHIKKLATFAVVLSLAIPSTVFAAETKDDTTTNVTSIQRLGDDNGISLQSSFTTGDHYLGYVTVTKTNQAGGSAHILYGKELQVKPAWKAIDSTTSEVNIRIWVYDETGGYTVLDHTFTPEEDVDGKDADGYWYAESPWSPVALTPGHSYRFYYDATTAYGYKPTGKTRQALCHVWFNLK